jgi:hypothetical protein
MKNLSVPSPDTSEVRWLYAIVLIGFIFRVITVLALDFQPESDYAGYQTMAINFLNGKGLVDSYGSHMLSAGYPLFILTPVFALSGNSLLAAQLVNACLGVISVSLCYFVAQAAGAGRIGRLLAAALWALYLPSWVYAEYLAKENLMIPLMLGVMYCALRLATKRSFLMATVCGSLFGLLAISGNAALSLALPVFFALLIMPATLKQKSLISGLIILVSFTVAVPWMVRNHQVLGAYVLNTNGGFNLYIGNNPAATGMFISIADTPIGSKNWHALIEQQGEVQASEILKREAISWITKHPTEFVALALKKATLFWTPPIHKGEVPGSYLETIMRQIWLLQFVILGVAAICGFCSPSFWTKKTVMLWLAIIGYTSVHMLFYVIFRYREPIMPILCVIVSLVIEMLLISKKSV